MGIHRKYIQNLIHQTYKDIKIIILNDCSTNSLCKIYKKYLQVGKRLKVFNIKSYSISVARNVGLKNVKADWISFIEIDYCLEINNSWISKKIIFMKIKNIVHR